MLNEEFMLGSTRGNPTIIAEAPALYMDGRFQICRHLFYQVFMIRAFKHSQQFPLSYFLLHGKSRETYNISLILFEEAAQNFSLSAEPERILTDFEQYNSQLQYASQGTGASFTSHKSFGEISRV